MTRQAPSLRAKIAQSTIGSMRCRVEGRVVSRLRPCPPGRPDGDEAVKE